MSSKVESVSIPVVEEEVRLRREPVETGRVRVRAVAEERTETASEALLHAAPARLGCTLGGLKRQWQLQELS